MTEEREREREREESFQIRETLMGKREWCGKREEELLKEFRVEKSDSDEVSVPLFFFLSFSWTRCWLPVLCLLNLSYLRERVKGKRNLYIFESVVRRRYVDFLRALPGFLFDGYFLLRG